jgi:predicted Zn finger-like uncharacterized protein
VIFSCPTCAQSFRVGDDAAGKKVVCPKCFQKILVPTPPKPPPPVPTPSSKTTLGKLVDEELPSLPPATSSPRPHEETPADGEIIIVEYHAPKPPPKGSLPTPPEDDRPKHGREKSSEFDFDSEDHRPPKRGRYRDEYDDEEDDSRRSRRQRRWRCPYCGSREIPLKTRQISLAGWMVILLCWPLFWIGMSMKEDHLECYDCGLKVGR